jgi:hypothetical protein
VGHAVVAAPLGTIVLRLSLATTATDPERS